MKYVLVTGGAQGLGKEIVLAYAKNNYNIIIGYYSNMNKAKELSEYISDNYKIKSIIYKLDITNENNVKDVFNKFDIDILINNSALCNDNYIEDKSYEEFMEVVKVNLGGTYLMCKYAEKVNTIINISSKDGIDTFNPISLDYSASKAGIINLSKNLSLYYKNKKIICVCPGWINTDSVISMNPIYLKNELDRINQKELLDKVYVANKIFEYSISNIKSGSVVIIDEQR